MEQIDELQNPGRNSLYVKFPHISAYSAVLSASIELQFFRLLFYNNNIKNILEIRIYPFLCRAIRELVIERSEAANEAKLSRLQRTEFYLGIIDIKTKHQLRHLTSDKVGKLIRISGQVVRTHQVHPELCFGTFVCDDCGVAIKHVAQQFKYTQVGIMNTFFFIIF